MSVLLIIKLKEIIYSGENIGDDLSFQFDVKGQVTHVKTKISFGQHKSFNKALFQETFTEGSVSLPISVDITEEDPVFHDTGSGSSNFNVQLQESEIQTHSFNANVIASGGDKGKTATFTFIMEADVENVLKAELYLTFDDGPSPGTDDCIAVMNNKEVKGTFFMVGSHMTTDWQKQQVVSANNSGHLLGNHSYSHWHQASNYADPPSGKSNAEWLQDFQNNDQEISEILSLDPDQQFQYSRLPGKNAWRVGDIGKDDGNSARVANHLSENGYKIYGWHLEWRYSGTPGASDPVETAQQMADKVKDLLTSGSPVKSGKVILLMHDHMFRESRDNRQKLADFIQKVKDLGLGVEFKRVGNY